VPVLAYSIIMAARKRKIRDEGDLLQLLRKNSQMIVIQMRNMSCNYLVVAVVCVALPG
jgi:hypothetical protein